MKRPLLLFAFLAVVGCSKIEEPAVENITGEAEVAEPIRFGISSGHETKSELGSVVHEDSLFCVTCEDLEPFCLNEPDTKVSVTTQSNLTSFYLNTTSGSSESLVSSNIVFTGSSGSTYSASAGMYWPASDPSYHFYASNAQMQSGSSSYNLISCSADQDIVYAYNSSPVHRQTNSLSFNHVYGRIGSITISAPSGFTGTLSSATITAPKSGTFNIKTGAWSSTASAQNITLSSSNDVWVVPGTFNMSVTFSLSDGTTTKSNITRSGNVTIYANYVNKISVVVNDSYDYELVVSPSSANINIGDTKAYTATYNTKYGSSLINAQDVTSSATWGSSNTSVATVSSGTATGTGAGTATLTASYLSCNGTASVSVSDYISYWDDPTVSLSYSPNSFTAAGGTATPTVTYSQVAHYASGATKTYTSGGTISYEEVSGVSGFSLNTSNGYVTVGANTGSSRSYTVKVKVSMNGHTGSATASISQSADGVSYWDNPVVTLSYGTNPIAYTGGTSNPTLSYSQVGHLTSGGTTTVYSGATAISYKGSATGMSVNSSNGIVTASSNEGTTSTSYSNISIGSFSYSTSYIAYTGGSATSSLSYSQTKTVTRSATSQKSITVTASVTCNGKTGSATCTVIQSADPGSTNSSTITSGANVSYSGSATGFSLNSSSGTVTAASNVGSNYTTYSTPTVNLSYSPSTINAAGGNSSPTVTYSQTVKTGRNSTSARSISVTVTVSMNSKSASKTVTIYQNADSGTSSSSTVKSGGSITYSMPSSTGFTLNTSNGVVTVSTNTSQSSRTATVTATVTLNGKSGSATKTITQGGAIVIDFDD